ncbi:MAG: carcinine hydrolase/isopenicillin-N N-acyltransferase family protein, partial [Dongiaceae bacterium]
SLTFGGRQVVGDGFGVPLILRYILEFCGTVAEAAEVLKRVPSHMAYNVTAVDRSGAYITAFVAPDRPTLVRPHPIATNHQDQIEWAQHAEATATVARERYLVAQLSTSGTSVGSLAESFLYPPLFTDAYAKGFGTIYTALYWPRRGEVELRWPGGVAWRQSFDRFEPGTCARHFGPKG